MNTNDPQASYGEPMLRDKAIESMVRNYVDRELSFTIMDDKFDAAMADASRAATATGEHVRYFYENLITEGKLRVVEDPMSVQAAALSILNDGGSQHLLVTGDTARFLLFDKRGQQHSIFQEMAGFPLHELRVVEDCGCQEKFTRKLQTGI